MADTDNGWAESAGAWIAAMRDGLGDSTRADVLDAPMLARVAAGGFSTALDVGCGEGRFCRLLAARGLRVIGIDPTEPLLAEARRRDPAGDYRAGRAETLDFPDAGFDLVVSYLTLLDIDGIETAIPEMVRVLKPGGALLIANLNSFCTAGWWSRDAAGELRFVIDRYAEARAEWVEWSGIRIRNWHRPFAMYLGLLLGQGLRLVHYDEPPAVGADPAHSAKYRRVPYFHMMEWRKDLAG